MTVETCVGTMNGLNRMDLRVDRVYSLNDMAAYKQSPLYHTWISSLYVDRQKRFWVGTNKGLYLYDYENDSFILNDLEGELPRDQIMVINEDHDGNLLVGTLQNGLYICDSKLNLLSHYFKNTTPFSLTDNNISAIHEDSEGRLWWEPVRWIEPDRHGDKCCYALYCLERQTGK